VTPHRFIALNGAFNFRDLGGYATSDGRSTRWGRLYRSDSLHNLTQEDIRIVRDLGIGSLIDLRTPSEARRTGRGFMEAEPISYLNVSVTGEGSELEKRPLPSMGDDLADRYLSYLDGGRAAFVDALRLMADPRSYPLVFSCFFGKDRSGVLAALVLSCLGVEPMDIADDYALSEARMTHLVTFLRQDAAYSDTIDRTPPSLLSANAGTMGSFLGALEQQHGGARRWALDAGISSRDLDSLSLLLLQ
jgi:protein-tyrosine phosphatase